MRYTETALRRALVECYCGTPHDSIYVPGYGWGCRYAGGEVTHRASGLVIRAHQCHLCNCYFCLPALTPPEKRVCDNCGGPAIPTGEPSSVPDVLVLRDFPDSGGNAEAA